MTTSGRSESPAIEEPVQPEITPIIEAPEPPRRVHRPLDLVRLLVSAVSLAIAMLVGAFTTNTVAGIDKDVTNATEPLPAALGVLITTGSGLLMLALPAVIVFDLLIRRRIRILADGALAFLACLAWVAALQSVLRQLANADALAASLTAAQAADPGITGFSAGVAAIATVAQVGRQPRLRVLATVVFVLFGLAQVTLGATAVAVLISFLIGRVVGMFVRWAAGTNPSRPSPRAVVAELRRAGVDLVSLRPRHLDTEDPVFFDAVDTNGRALVVHVLDRDHEGAGVLQAFWRTLRFREPAGRKALVSLRRAVEHEALISAVMAATGARVQAMVAAVPVEPDAVVLAYEDVPGPSLDEIDELDDARLDATWAQVLLLHRRAIAHRALTGSNIVFPPDGGAGLRFSGAAGLIAAPVAALRIDLAQLLVTLALKVGVDRAVDSALRALGTGRLAEAVSALQPVALGRTSRQALRRDKTLLDTLRDRILDLLGTVPPAQPVRLERLRPRTIISVVALTAAAYVLLDQIAGLDLVEVITSANWLWLGIAIVLACIRFVGAGIALTGFVAERLRFARTLIVQVASSFLGLVAPAGVGGAALNVRYLQQAGVPAAAAVAAVALWQIGTVGVTVLLLVVVGLVAGNDRARSLEVPDAAFYTLGVVVAVVAIVFMIPVGRRFLLARLRPYLAQITPRLATVFTRPARLGAGVFGTILQSVATVLVMSACIEGFGGSLSWSVVAVVVLAGTALGSAAPTPGGLGAVEAVLSAGLTAGGLDGATAVSSVLLFRLLTFWLPVLPGWLAFTWLSRKELV
ncbi:lysylphosphatidylglycerol synthase transmembrane domain-containing protein [Cryptosporangium phraense]|uniref:Flippase-like domain-containing protein n=1 Tax=Cryptosporangium phraense TaxID=2593070 RepID=A0A545ALS9_9ACTN|nr:lysylphosphatidylglycerol synthase transmembrane domain-containing protein [Cryptosporangium phraense]TQS42278.1 flippase-like domain-containing protein [Cryptosporangium phraense]